MPKILQMIGYNTLEIGIVFAIAPLTRALIPFVFLKHIKLTKNIFLISLFMLFISALAFYFTIDNFYLFLLPNLLLGACMGLMLPFIETYAMDYLKKRDMANHAFMAHLVLCLSV